MFFILYKDFESISVFGFYICKKVYKCIYLTKSLIYIGVARVLPSYYSPVSGPTTKWRENPRKGTTKYLHGIFAETFFGQRKKSLINDETVSRSLVSLFLFYIFNYTFEKNHFMYVRMETIYINHLCVSVWNRMKFRFIDSILSEFSPQTDHIIYVN